MGRPRPQAIIKQVDCMGRPRPQTTIKQVDCCGSTSGLGARHFESSDLGRVGGFLGTVLPGPGRLRSLACLDGTSEESALRSDVQGIRSPSGG